MGKKEKRSSKSGSNGSGKKPDSISTVDRLSLQLTAEKRRSLELQKQNLELQKQVLLLRSQMVDLQSKQALEQLGKSEADLQASWESQLKNLKTGYGLDLEKDSVNTETGLITWNAVEEEPTSAEEDSAEIEE